MSIEMFADGADEPFVESFCGGFDALRECADCDDWMGLGENHGLFLRWYVEGVPVFWFPLLDYPSERTASA